MAMGVVDGLEVVEIDDQQRKRLVAAVRSRAFVARRCSNCRRLPTPVRSSIIARSATSLRSRSIAISRKPKLQTMDRNNQRQDPDRLRRVEMGEGEVAADLKQLVDARNAQTAMITIATKPASRAPALARPSRFGSSNVSERASGADKPQEKIRMRDGRTVIAKDEDRKAGKRQRRHRRGLPPGHRLAIEPPDAHRRKANRENSRRAAKQQRDQRIRESRQHREHRRTGDGQSRASPVPRRLKAWIAVQDVGPDQAEREEIDNERRPKRRNVQH